MINIDTLYENQHRIQNMKIESYEKVLNRITTLIKRRNLMKQYELLYEIPVHVTGSNLFIDKEACGLFITKKLINLKFNVKMLKYKKTGTVRLYISWKTHMKEYLFNKRMADDNNKKVKSYFSKLNNQLLNDL
jgi:hypothetical protein